MTENIIEIYKRCGNFHEAVKLSGLPPLKAHIKLLSSGVLKIQDKVKYGNEMQKRGGEAEALFQKLVHEAIDANTYWQANNPVYDFMYKGLAIDIKYSSYIKNKKLANTRVWQVRTKGGREGLDLFVAFCERDVGTKLNDPYCLLIPAAFITAKDGITIFKNGKWFENFKVELDELKNILDMYAENLGENKK